MEKVVIATGSRASWGLLEPLARMLRCQDVWVNVLATGSHLSWQFGHTIDNISYDLNPIECPCIVDYDTPVGVAQSLGMAIQNAAMILNGRLPAFRPDGIIILGDRYEMLGVAQAAYILGIPIIHFQGGDVTTGSLDNGYRDCITRLATYHLVASDYSGARIIPFVDPGKMYNVGSLACVIPKLVDIDGDIPDYIVVTHQLDIHEIERVFKPDDVVMWIGDNADAGGMEANTNIYLKSLDRVAYLTWLSNVKAIIGNSSSGIFEAPMVQTDTINIGDRQNGRATTDSVINVECEVGAIRAAIAEVDKRRKEDPAGERFKGSTYYQPGTISKSTKLIKSF
jgi:UDP-N-acetylglucosamine 2-epimerase